MQNDIYSHSSLIQTSSSIQDIYCFFQNIFTPQQQKKITFTANFDLPMIRTGTSLYWDYNRCQMHHSGNGTATENVQKTKCIMNKNNRQLKSTQRILFCDTYRTCWLQFVSVNGQSCIYKEEISFGPCVSNKAHKIEDFLSFIYKYFTNKCDKNNVLNIQYY